MLYTILGIIGKICLAIILVAGLIVVIIDSLGLDENEKEVLKDWNNRTKK